MKKSILLLVVLAMVLSLCLTACVDRKVSNLKIVDGTFKYEYEVGETVDLSGLKVIATYSDGSEREIASDKLTLGTIDTSTTGTKKFTVEFGGYTLTVEVKVTKTIVAPQVTLESIAIDPTSVSSKVKVGETYSTADLKVTATYSDNSKKDIALADLTVTAPDTATAGAKKLTVSYEGKTAELAVTVVGVKSLTLIGAPASVNKGETLATSGITASVVYTDDTSETLANEKLTFAAFDTAEAGLKTLTATYLDGQATASIPVIEAISINVSGVNDFTTNIPDGQNIDLAAVKAAATISVNYGYGETIVTTEAVADTSTLTVTDGEVEGVRYLTFTYAGLTKSIQVLEGAAVIESIALNFGTAKNYVAQDHAFATAGIYLVATYTNDTTANITEGFTLSAIATTAAGEQTLTATYDGKTATATVYVLPATAIAVDGTPALSVMKGEALDAAAIAALTFTVTYSDNSGHIVTESGISIADMAIGTIDTTVGGDKTFAVTYKGATGAVPFYVHTERTLTLIPDDDGNYGVNSVIKGESINLDVLKFTLTYTDGSSKVIAYEDGGITVSGFDPNLVGTQSVSVSYGDATGTFSVTVNDFELVEALLPNRVTDFKPESNTNFLEHDNLEYVVGDDNDYVLTLVISALDSNDRDVTITNYKSKTWVYLVEGATETLLEGAALDQYVEYIDEFKNAVNFTEAAIGKTFKLATVPELLASDPSSIRTQTFKVVNGWNIFEAKELNILTNFSDKFLNDGTKTQLEVVNNYLEQQGIDKPTSPIGGAILHGDMYITKDTIPAEYTIDMGDGTFTLFNKFALFAHSVDYLNTETGKYEFNFHGNYFSIFTYGVPLINTDPTKGNVAFGTDEGGDGVNDDVSTTSLFRFDAAAAYTTDPNTFDPSNYVFNMYNLYLMDDNPDNPAGSVEDSHRAMRGLIGMKFSHVDAKVYNIIIERYYISFFPDRDGVKVELNRSKLYNAWQNHIFMFGDNWVAIQNGQLSVAPEASYDNNIKLNIVDCEITACGGPVIIAQTRNKWGDTDAICNIYSSPDVTIDDKTEIHTYVTANSAWFNAFGASAYVTQIEAINQVFNAYGHSFQVNDPDGNEGRYLNIIMLNMSSGFGTTSVGDVDGSLSIGGTTIMNMNDSNFQAAMVALMTAGYTQDQAQQMIFGGLAADYGLDYNGNLAVDAINMVSGGIAPIFQSTIATAGANTLGSTAYFDGSALQSLAGAVGPTHGVFGTEYVTLYYNGMGIVFGGVT